MGDLKTKKTELQPTNATPAGQQPAGANVTPITVDGSRGARISFPFGARGVKNDLVDFFDDNDIDFFDAKGQLWSVGTDESGRLVAYKFTGDAAHPWKSKPEATIPSDVKKLYDSLSTLRPEVLAGAGIGAKQTSPDAEAGASAKTAESYPGAVRKSDEEGNSYVAIPNPARKGAKATDVDAPIFFDDGAISFLCAINTSPENGTKANFESREYMSGPDHTFERVFRDADGSVVKTEPVRLDKVPAEAIAIDKSLRGLSEAVLATEDGESQPKDSVERTAPSGVESRLNQFDERLKALETENKSLRAENAEFKAQSAADHAVVEGDHKAEQAREAEEAEKKRKPGFFRAFLEGLEALLRSLPVIGQLLNFISACVRGLRIIIKLIKGEKINWLREGAGMATDIAGCFIPIIGGLGNLAENLVFTAPENKGARGIRGGQSQIMGGINELWEGDGEVRNPFREGLGIVGDVFSSSAESTGAVVSGGQKSIKAGSEDDDGASPTTPDGSTSAPAAASVRAGAKVQANANVAIET